MTTTIEIRIPKTLILFVILAALVLTIAPAIPQVVVQPHAEAKHGAEAVEVRECTNITSIWINKTLQRFNLLKELPDGRCGLQIIQPRKCGLPLEITAYIVNWDGVSEASAVERMLKAKGCERVWNK